MDTHIYKLQKSNFLGGLALVNNSNNEVSSASVWTIPVTSNTSIIRMFSDNMAYMAYGTTANSIIYDYLLPANASIDIYNIVNANNVSFIADSANCKIKISQY